MPGGCVVWITGLTASGKSTVAQALCKALVAGHIPSVVLDGDALRKGVSADLDFSDRGRLEHNRRVAEVAKLFADAGLVAIVALISPLAEHRALARGIARPHSFVEVYCKCELKDCEARDYKQLYRRCRAGEVVGVPGLDSPYEVPLAPEVTLDTRGGAVSDHVFTLASVVKGARSV